MTALCPNCHGDCCVNKRGSVVDHGSAFALHSCPDCLDGYALDLAVARLDALLDAERENTALRAEVAYLRKERAAVVAWLRERHAATQEWDGRVNAVSHTYEHAADAIERGEHRREETK